MELKTLKDLDFADMASGDHGSACFANDDGIKKELRKELGMKYIKEIDRILAMVPNNKINVGRDEDRGSRWVAISEILQYKQRNQSEIYLKNYEERTGKTREVIIEELEKLSKEIKQKEEEQEKAMKAMGFTREFEDFGNETFLHLISSRNFLMLIFNIAKENLK